MLNKISKYIIKPIHVISFFALLAMVVLVVIQIFCRFVLNISVPWTEEMSRLCFVWVIFLGSAIVECDGGQVSTTLLVDWLPPVPKFILNTVIYILEIIFNICLFIGCFESWDTVSMMSFSTVPMWDYRLLYIPVIIGVPFMIFYLIVQNIQLYRTLFPAQKELR